MQTQIIAAKPTTLPIASNTTALVFRQIRYTTLEILSKADKLLDIKKSTFYVTVFL
jgi:hypothetical protein